MFLIDVNVLVYAHREDTPEHSAYREWLESTINGIVPYDYSELVLSGFLRVVTHPSVFEVSSALPSAVRFANQVRESQHAVCRAPGPVHWRIFLKCIEQIDAKQSRGSDPIKVNHIDACYSSVCMNLSSIFPIFAIGIASY